MFSNLEEPEHFWRECLISVRSVADIEDDEYDGGTIKRQWLSQFEFVKLFTTLPEPKFLKWWALFHRKESANKGKQRNDKYMTFSTNFHAILSNLYVL